MLFRSQFEALAGQMTFVSPEVWRLIGGIEILGSVLLIVPSALRKMPKLTPIAAAVLAVESFGLAAKYAEASIDVSVNNPMTWALVMGVLVAFVAYGRGVAHPVTTRP